MKLPYASQEELKNKDYILFAQVGRPHGLKGGFFLKTPDNRTVWNHYPQLVLEKKSGFHLLTVKQFISSGKALVIFLEDLNTRNDVEELYLSNLYVHKSEIHLENDEVIVNDLENMLVENEAGKQIGICLGVVNFGAQDNLRILLNETKEEFLFPILPEFVLEIDEKNKKIRIRDESSFLP